MASTYSNDLKLEIMTTGEKAGQWGTITNTNLNILAQSSSGVLSKGMVTANPYDTALPLTDGSTSEGKNLYIKLTGTLAANSTVTMAAAGARVFILEDTTNRTTSNFTINVLTTGSGTPVALPAGSTCMFYSDGTNSYRASVLKQGTVSINSANTTSYTAVDTDQILISTTSNTVAITLPATPTTGQEVTIMDVSATGGFASNNVTVARNGQPIQGAATNFTMNVNNQSITFIYTDVTKGWLLKSTNQ
tara:strand:+ start:117 stop:860 length:744 start_codon:yes stop_codon:yes gene_type:complete